MHKKATGSAVSMRAADNHIIRRVYIAIARL